MTKSMRDDGAVASARLRNRSASANAAGNQTQAPRRSIDVALIRTELCTPCLQVAGSKGGYRAAVEGDHGTGDVNRQHRCQAQEGQQVIVAQRRLVEAEQLEQRRQVTELLTRSGRGAA